jgi:predicted nicotinamide N-methyase
MQKPETTIQEITVGGQMLQLYIPEPASVRRSYEQNNTSFPYWAKIWPAALGLCEFLAEHTWLIKDKTVVEFAAGLGLPSLFAARYSRSVAVSDHAVDAVNIMQQSIRLNHLSNIHCSMIDWNDVPADITGDVILLSDVNYDPDVFEKVYEVISRFMKTGSTVILSTPQRLMAKPFIERLLPFCRQQEEIIVRNEGIDTAVSILVLHH